MLERKHAPALTAYYGELAHHFGAAAAGTADKAVDYAIKAGDHAMAQVAWETAIQHYQHALDVLDLQAQSRAELRCDVLLALGAAHYHTVLDISESPDGRSAFLQAAEIAKTLGAFDRLARAALGFAGLNVVRSSGGLQQVELLEAALAIAPPEDGPLKARLMARLAVDCRLVDARSDRRIALSDAALGMAKRLADPAVLGPVLGARHCAIWSPDSVYERLSIGDEAWRAAVAAGDLYHAMWGQLFLALASHEVGDEEGVRRGFASFAETARKSGIPYFRAVERLVQAATAVNEGMFPKAETDTRLITDSDSLPFFYVRAILLFQVRREQGRLQEIELLLKTVIERTSDSIDPYDRHRGHVARAMLMLRHLDADASDAARPLFEAMAGRDFADIPKDAYWLATVVLLADACAALADKKRAATLCEMVGPYEHRNAVPASSHLSFGAVSYYVGLLATVLARWDAATRSFENALEMNIRMRARPAVARTQYAFADMLVKRNVRNDRTRACELLDSSLETARQLGMTRLVAQAEALSGMIGSPSKVARSAGALVHALSPRELQVLTLIVAGQSDRQIAEKLVISQRTVTTHVTHIFSKLGLANRAEAAAFAVRHGLA